MNLIPLPLNPKNAKSTSPSAMDSTDMSSGQTPTLLLVDDDRVMRLTLREALKSHGYNLKVVQNGEEGLGILESHFRHIDAVILDRELPGMSGIDMAERMKADPRMSGIPIIMLTGTSEQEKIQEGIDAGVYYYLVKPTNHVLLCKIIDAALRDRKQKQALITELGRHSTAIKTMNSCRMTLHTLTEAEDAACFLAACFPEPTRVISGLMELLVNAVEHGNLAVPSETKQKLMAENMWHEELDRRALLPENTSKKVEVIYQSKDEGFLVQITDSGDGFDWTRHWHINPSRASAAYGRGIARARITAFDRMAYNEKGNSVTVMVSKVTPKEYAW